MAGSTTPNAYRLGAGKWNDGSPANRQILADRVAAGMTRAWEATRKTPITAADHEARDLDEVRDRLDRLLPFRVDRAVAEHREPERTAQNQARAPDHLAEVLVEPGLLGDRFQFTTQDGERRPELV